MPKALAELYGGISDLQNSHQDVLCSVNWDLNHTTLKSVLSKFHQYIHFAIKHGWCTHPPWLLRPHLHNADPANRRRSGPQEIWPPLLFRTDWNMFRDAAVYCGSTNLDNKASVMDTSTAWMIPRPSQKNPTRSYGWQWRCALLRTLDTITFRSGDKAPEETARTNLSWAIRAEKCKLTQKIQTVC